MNTINIKTSLEASNQLKLIDQNSVSQNISEKISVDQYTVNLSDCSSGLSGVNESTGDIHVHVGDTSCLGKLSSFTLQGVEYLPSGIGSVPFTKWIEGDTAVYVGSDNRVNVTVAHQLSSPITATDFVKYNFEIIHERNKNSTGGVTVEGLDAPNFKITKSGLIDMVSSGAGLFTFELECVTGPMTPGVNEACNSFCPDVVAGGTLQNGASGVDLNNGFSYKLIADPMNGGVGGTLTFEQAQAAFIAGGDTQSLKTKILSDSTGFQTIVLEGSGPLAKSPKMILILQAKSLNPKFSSDPTHSSFQYFPINVIIPE